MNIIYCDTCGYIKGNFKKIESKCPVCNNELKYIEQIDTDEVKQIIKMNRTEKNQYIENLSGHPIDSSYKNKLLDYEIENHNKNQQKIKPVPKCPTCQSTNIRKMSAIESRASIFTFGLYSKKINKTFKCNNCSYTW